MLGQCVVCDGVRCSRRRTSGGRVAAALWPRTGVDWPPPAILPAAAPPTLYRQLVVVTPCILPTAITHTAHTKGERARNSGRVHGGTVSPTNPPTPCPGARCLGCLLLCPTLPPVLGPIASRNDRNYHSEFALQRRQDACPPPCPTRQAPRLRSSRPQSLARSKYCSSQTS